MNLMKAVDKYDRKTYCIAWLPDGKSFVIRDKEEFKEKVLSKYFKATKFSSFTRKLYRWGFRQVNRHIGPNENDQKAMLSEIGFNSVEELINQTIPAGIRLKKDLSISNAMTEQEYLTHIKSLGAKNKV